MQKFVEMLIGRLATDPTLRRRFAENPGALLEELLQLGLELNEVEREALAAIDPTSLDRFARRLDRRLQRARKAAPESPDLPSIASHTTSSQENES